MCSVKRNVCRARVLFSRAPFFPFRYVRARCHHRYKYRKHTVRRGVYFACEIRDNFARARCDVSIVTRNIIDARDACNRMSDATASFPPFVYLRN